MTPRALTTLVLLVTGSAALLAAATGHAPNTFPLRIAALAAIYAACALNYTNPR